MHTYASQTPEACELVSELEFVWDQIKYNASSSSGSGPLNAVGVPPLSRHQGSAYGSINGRLAQSPEEYERPNLRANDGHDSRLRVLSPVSQPEEEEYYRRRRRDSRDDIDDQAIDDEEDDEDEEYEEARDSLYEDQDQASTATDTNTGTDRTASHGDSRSQHRHHHHQDSIAASCSGDLESNSHHRRDSQDPSNPRNSRWRRRVEQALTKMTAEIAAVREQMEGRTLANRRRSDLWVWPQWILWSVTRQIIWDLALLGGLLIYMRMRGDRRVEDRLRSGWLELKTRLGRFKLLSLFNKAPLLP